MRWFKMWSEARTDNKLRSLDDAQHRTWFNLLCMANDHEVRGTVPAMKPKLLALEVSGGDVALLERTLAELADLDIVERLQDGAIAFLHFTKRQDSKPSDEPEATRERKQRQRDREREAAGQGRDTTPTSRHEREKEKREEGDQTRPEGGNALARDAAPVGPVGASADQAESRSPASKSGGALLNLKLGPARGEPETWPFTAEDLAVLLPAADYFGAADAREVPTKILVALGKKYPDASERWLAMAPATVAAWCAEVAKKTRATKGANQPADPGLFTYAAAIIGGRIEAKQDLLAQPEPAAVAPGRRVTGERRSTQQRNMDVLRTAAARRQAETAVGQ
jgi:hypothetical protein